MGRGGGGVHQDIAAGQIVALLHLALSSVGAWGGGGAAAAQVQILCVLMWQLWGVLMWQLW